MDAHENLTNKVHRVKFKKWAELEDLRESFIRAAEDNADNFPDKVVAYLSAALDIDKEELKNLDWVDSIELFYLVYSSNLPSVSLPIISDVPKEKKPQSKLDWDYDGRTWYSYAHMISSSYGWTLEYIAELEIDDALALIQEILTDRQLDREFLWGMSEIAYPYNKATKQSKFSPLPRPYWMLGKSKEVKKVRIPESMMPQGLIIDVKDLARTTESQEADSGRNVAGS